MGQITNQMALEFVFNLMEKLKKKDREERTEKKKEKQ